MVTMLTGEQLEEIKQDAADHFWPHGRMAGDVSDESGLMVATGGKGVWVKDASGSQWFDAMAGLWLKAVGHGRKEIADAVYEQMQEIAYTPFDMVSPSTARLAAKVASISPDPDSRVYFVSGGSEAVETALKMAKSYHRLNGEPGRWKIISRRGSYHGATMACTSLGRGGDSTMDGGSIPADFGPLVPGNIHITNPDGYRGVFGSGIEAAKDLERAILHEGAGTVAAFIGEPISAASGIHVPDDEYWPAVRDICDKYGVLMICDEVINGFGRTGKMFATEHWGVKPDIFTVAKALTSGYVPIGAAIASSDVANAFLGDSANTFRHLFTFGGNPPACAAGLVNLDIIEREGLVENAARMGDYLLEQLQTLYEHPIVGDVRGGKGLLCAVELVKDRESKERFPADAKIGSRMGLLMREYNLLGRWGDVISLCPPLTITKDEVDHLVDAIGSLIGQLENDLGVQ